jgi:NPCBM/NEW2 domain/Protein of unknown function (DUF1583)
MQALVLVAIALVGAGGPSEYSRSLDSKALDQATLDAEGYGEKPSFKREGDGLRIILGPGEKETGWKTPQQVRVGGNFTITANFVIKKLPKPAQEDGAAFGVAIAFQDPNQPDLTLVRMIEPKGPDIYRAIEKATGNAGPMPMQMMRGRGMMPMMMGQGQGEQAKPVRRTFPAAGDTVRMELTREGNTIRCEIVDATSAKPRYLGQFELGQNDIAAIKLFASNRNGAEAINVLMRDLTVRADRVNGLGTVVRTVYDRLVYADPTSIDDGVLTLGGQPKPPKPEKPAPGMLPADVFVPVAAAGAPAAAPVAAAQPAAGAAPAAAAAPAATGPVTVVAAVPLAVPAGAVMVARAAPGPAGAVVMAQAAPQPEPSPNAAQQPAAASKPVVKVALDEVDSIRFERTPGLSARFVGQLNLDFTGPGLGAKKEETPAKAEAKKDATAKAEPAKADEKKAAPAKGAEPKKAEAKTAEPKKAEARKKDATPKAEEKKKDGAGDDVLAPPPGTTIAKFPKVEPQKNGIRDICLSLFGLRDAKIKQVMVNGQSSTGPASWRLDTTDSQDSPLLVRRAGNDMAADLFLEPPAGDCFQKPFQINIIYEDGQNANTNATADGHTKADLAVDAKAPAFARPDAWLYLTGDEKLFGKLDGIGRDTLKLTTPWQDHLEVPLARVVGVHLGALDRKETPESFAKRLKSAGPEDQLLAATKKGEVIVISGIIEGTEDDRLHFRYGDRTRTLSFKQVEGLIMAARAQPKRTDELMPTFSLAGGLVISGRWKDLDSSVWRVETSWGQELKLPAADILDVRVGGGKFVYLSDLSPTKTEETPYFGHRLAWRRNVNLLGEPLRMNGRTYDRGLAVHSRCILTYELSGRYSTFETSVGFDDAVKGRGRVECRVFADGKELYANPDLKASGQPVDLKLPVAGAARLRLVVDFGKEQDTGDRVIWANARLHRATPPAASAPKTASRPGAPRDSAAAIRRD